jgi:hypothetical protein
MANIQRRPSGIYVARLAIPARLQPIDLDGLVLPGTPMDHDSILKIAHGHPILTSGGYLPIRQAAAAAGIGVSDLLREATDGRT